MKDDSLTHRQERFCQEYMVDLNATQAAIRAGYSEKSASEIGYENLRKPQIEDRIEQLQKETVERLQMTADSVLVELAKYGFEPFDEPVRVADRLKALELIGRHLGLFKDKVEHVGNGAEVVIYLPDNGRSPNSPLNQNQD